MSPDLSSTGYADAFSAIDNGIGGDVDENAKRNAELSEKLANSNLDKARAYEDLKRKKDDRRLRKKHAGIAVSLAQMVIGVWIFLVFFSATMNLIQGRQFLSDYALATVTTGATLNVFAALVVVLKGLFPSKGD